MLTHIKTIRAGEPDFLSPTLRNTIDVFYDNKRYIYERPPRFTGANRKDWKITLACAFDATKIIGSGHVFNIVKD
jgi:hypothetical protein